MLRHACKLCRCKLEFAKANFLKSYGSPSDHVDIGCCFSSECFFLFAPSSFYCFQAAVHHPRWRDSASQLRVIPCNGSAAGEPCAAVCGFLSARCGAGERPGRLLQSLLSQGYRAPAAKELQMLSTCKCLHHVRVLYPWGSGQPKVGPV